MAHRITVTWWRDIPSVVTAGRGRTAVRVALPDRFQQAIDRAAARAGLVAEDAYLAAWRRVSRAAEDDDDGAEAEAARLEAAYPEERLGRLVAAGGIEDRAAAQQPEPGA